MNINLKKYQREALDKLVEESSRFLDRDGKGEIVVFQAPTGSGKTIVMARFIEELIKERKKDNLCFLWLSVGKGELHIQSRDSLRVMFDGFPKVSLVDEEFGGARSEILRNEVVVGNWEKLNKRDTNGEWKVTLMRDGEQVNFREVLAKTGEKRKIILIIDESHIGAGAPRMAEVREIINADVVVEVSATPKTTADLFMAFAPVAQASPRSCPRQL
jgi:type III restriction enzyme